MYVEIGTEAAQFLLWEYINGFFIALQYAGRGQCQCSSSQKVTKLSERGHEYELSADVLLKRDRVSGCDTTVDM